MAFTATDSTNEPRAFSIGAKKVQILTWSAVSGDTTGTVTSDSLDKIDHIVIDGNLAMSAAPTFSANVATLAFADPVASVFGTLILIGS